MGVIVNAEHVPVCHADDTSPTRGIIQRVAIRHWGQLRVERPMGDSRGLGLRSEAAIPDPDRVCLSLGASYRFPHACSVDLGYSHMPVSAALSLAHRRADSRSSGAPILNENAVQPPNQPSKVRVTNSYILSSRSTPPLRLTMSRVISSNLSTLPPYLAANARASSARANEPRVGPIDPVRLLPRT
jgi:hypothetical protein